MEELTQELINEIKAQDSHDEPDAAEVEVINYGDSEQDA